jgi:toxin ParE1/3/4
MDFKVVWTEPALADLHNICSYIANENPDAAQRVGEDILNHVEVLEAFPFIGPTYPRASSGQVREIVCGKYRIFYRVNEERKLVEILTIWHGARGTPVIPV